MSKVNKFSKFCWQLALPVTLLLAYLALSLYLQDGAGAKLLPTPDLLWQAFLRLLAPDPINSESLLWADSLSSIIRLLVALVATAAIGSCLALAMHNFILVRQLSYGTLLVLAQIPPLILLPLLLVWSGAVPELSTLMVFLGLFPATTLVLLTTLDRENQEREQYLRYLLPLRVNKIIFVDAPLLIPPLLRTMQDRVGLALVYLFATEMIGGTSGLGYRVFLLRRFLKMDEIIVYAIVAIALALLIYWLLGVCLRLIPWYSAD